ELMLATRVVLKAPSCAWFSASSWFDENTTSLEKFGICVVVRAFTWVVESAATCVLESAPIPSALRAAICVGAKELKVVGERLWTAVTESAAICAADKLEIDIRGPSWSREPTFSQPTRTPDASAS